MKIDIIINIDTYFAHNQINHMCNIIKLYTYLFMSTHFVFVILQS